MFTEVKKQTETPHRYKAWEVNLLNHRPVFPVLKHWSRTLWFRRGEKKHSVSCLDWNDFFHYCSRMNIQGLNLNTCSLSDDALCLLIFFYRKTCERLSRANSQEAPGQCPGTALLVIWFSATHNKILYVELSISPFQDTNQLAFCAWKRMRTVSSVH